MSNNLVSMENLDSILKAIRLGIVQKIDARDITPEQKAILLKADLIDTTTNNGKFLADNGTYIIIDATKITDVNIKTQVVMDLFKISYTNEHWDSTGIANMPTARHALTSQIYNGKIYCIGGYTSDLTNKVEIYDIVNNSWTTGTNMPTARYYLSSVLYNGKIYCIGGLNNNVLNIVEIYDIANNSWTTGTNMPTARFGLTSSIYNGKIYCIGGGNSNIVEIYDIVNNSWTTGTPMTTGSYKLTSSIYNNKIYCIGGYNSTNLNIVEIYDIANNSWTIGTPMTTARCELTSQLYNGKIYCIGGQNSNGNLNIVEIYDIANNTWTTGTPMTAARYRFTSVLYNGKVYCIGGFSTGTLNTVEILICGVNNYTLTLPTELQTKLDLIVDTGDGTKVLADNGTFIDIPLGYRFMTDTEISTEVANINSYTG